MNWKGFVRRSSMKPTRRLLLAYMLASLFLCAGDPQEAEAILFSGATSGAAPGLLTTITLVNTSGSTQATNFISPIFGHPFVQGQITTGTAPIFQLTNGTNVPFSMSTVPSYWSDGSLKHASFMLRVPTTIAGSGSLTINILSGGTVPSNSARSTADYTAGGLDLNVSMTGLDILSGVWTANLGQGITAAHGDDYKFMDGAAGRVDRIRASGRQSGADHGYLECYWYVAATQDASGNLGGIRYLPRLTQPWDATGLGPAGASQNWMSFSALTINNGASVVTDLWPSARSNVQNFSWNTSIAFNVANGNNETGACLRLTTTTALPTVGTYTGSISGTTMNISATLTGDLVIGGQITGTGVSANTYVTANLGGGNYTVTPSQTVASTTLTERLPTGRSLFNDFGNSSVCHIQNQSSFSGTYFTAVDNGTGTHTMTAYPYLPPFCSIFGATSTGTFNYIQGNGSIAADSTVRVTHDKYYIRQTKMVPAYDLRNVSPTSMAATSYVVNGAGPVGRNPELTGAAPNIGWLPRYQSTHLFTQAAVDETNVRVTGLTAGLSSLNYRRKASNATIICLNNGPTASGTAYSGMMTPSPNYTEIAAADSRVATIGFFNTTTHGPNLPYYPFLITGEPQYLDMMYEWPVGQLAGHQNATSSINIDASHYTLADGGGRNISSGGTTYYGALFGTSSTRYDGWMYRNVSCAAAFSHPESASYKTYLNDLVAATANMATRAIALSPTAYLQTNGLWLNNQAYYCQPWMHGYAMMTFMQTYNITENTNIKAACQKLIDWWNHVVLVKTAYSTVGGAQIIIRPTTTYQGPLLTDDLALACTGGNMRWSNGSANFTTDPLGSGAVPWVPAVGDLIYWTEFTESHNNTPIPAAFTPYVPYYVLTKSGSSVPYTLTLTTTKSVAFGGPGGGSAVVNTDNDPGYAVEFYFQPGTPPATGAYSDASDASGFIANHRGNLNQAVASGLSVNSTAQTEVNNRWNGSGGGFGADVTWAMTNSYAYAA